MRSLKLKRLPLYAGSPHLTITLKETAKKHAKPRYDNNSGLGLADDTRTLRRGRWISFLSRCGVQKRSLPDHEKPLAQHNLRSYSWRDVRCALKTGDVNSEVTHLPKETVKQSDKLRFPPETIEFGIHIQPGKPAAPLPIRLLSATRVNAPGHQGRRTQPQHGSPRGRGHAIVR